MSQAPARLTPAAHSVVACAPPLSWPDHQTVRSFPWTSIVNSGSTTLTGDPTGRLNPLHRSFPQQWCHGHLNLPPVRREAERFTVNDALCERKIPYLKKMNPATK